MNQEKSKHQRSGVLSVEMAFVVPVVLLIFFGLWEWSRVEMIKHVCENAVFEGARQGTLPGATETDTETKIQSILNSYLIKGAIVDATFNTGTGESTVTISVPIDSNVTLGYAFFAGKAINAEMTLFQ